MEVARRQPSQSSCAASERILALGHRTVPSSVAPLAPVDLNDADDHEQKITEALGAIKEQLAELMKTCPLGRFLNAIRRLSPSRRELSTLNVISIDVLGEISEVLPLRSSQRIPHSTCQACPVPHTSVPFGSRTSLPAWMRILCLQKYRFANAGLTAFSVLAPASAVSFWTQPEGASGQIGML